MLTDSVNVVVLPIYSSLVTNPIHIIGSNLTSILGVPPRHSCQVSQLVLSAPKAGSVGTLISFKSDNADTMAALQTARKSLAMMLAVTGLRDQQLCKELLAMNGLTWEQLSNISKCVSTAKESIDKLGVNKK